MHEKEKESSGSKFGKNGEGKEEEIIFKGEDEEEEAHARCSKTEMDEEWKDISGYEGRYKISNRGRVMSLTRFTSSCYGSTRKIKGRILVTRLCRGYVYITLHKNGLQTLRVHTLVADAFLEPSSKPQINHKNGIKTDNRPENLEWVTALENIHHAHKNGLRRYVSGESHYKTTLKEQDVREIRLRFKSGERYVHLARSFNVAWSVVRDVIKRLTWKHVHP